MKRALLYIIITFCLLPAFGREVVNINRDWKFFSSSEVSSDAALTINIPHIWNNDALSGKRDYFRGIGNYLKDIDIPSSWNGKRVFIKCYGANTIASVIVNGKLVGEHSAGYTTFAFEITDYIQYGRKNKFWIMVNNSPQTDVLPVAGDQNSYGGIFRDLELISTDNQMVAVTDYGSDGVYIVQKKVTDNRVDGEAIVKVSGVTDNTVTAKVIISGGRDTVVQVETKVRLSGRTTSTARIPFSFPNPRLWNGTEDPYMYRVTVKIVDGNRETDQVTVRTGFRYILADAERGFFLNGKRYPIRGVVVHQDRAVTGTAITSYQVREDFDLIRDMGANAVRIAGVVHNPEFYDMCDRNGVLVWSDMPLIGPAYLTDHAFFDTESFRRNGKLQAEEIIRQQFNRPSIVVWGLFSELNTRGDDPTDYIYELNTAIKREDPSRLTGAASNEDGEINFITDLILWNHFLGWKEGRPADIVTWKNQLHNHWSSLRSGVSYSAGASIFHQDEMLQRPQWNGNWHPERWQTYLHEQYFRHLSTDSLFWGFFVGNMFDYGAAGRTWGEGSGINDMGIVTFDRKYCKDAYYFYKANWNREEPFVYIAERRWDRRSSSEQDIKVFSNCSEAELFVNGISEGTIKGERGTFIWHGTELREGSNVIEVRSGNIRDRVRIEITG